MKIKKIEFACGHCGCEIGRALERHVCHKCGYVNYWHKDLLQYKAYSQGIESSTGKRFV